MIEGVSAPEIRTLYFVVGPEESGKRSPASVETRALGQVGKQVQTRYSAWPFFVLKAALVGVIQFITALTTRAVSN